jgi:hypothetical protein
MYHWRGVLIREGRWHTEPRPKASARSGSHSQLAVRFAKVAMTELCPPMPVTVRLQLANGRCAEIDLTGIEQFASVLGTLERQP